MAAPPLLSGVSQVSVTSPSPGIASSMRGIDGVVAGVADTVAASPSPCVFTARTSNPYDVPLVRSITVTCRSDSGIQSPPRSTRYS